MVLSFWIARVLRLPFRASRRQRRASRRGTLLAFRPHLEMLEDRVVPSVLTVNSTADSTAASNYLTLREAILLVDNGGNAQAALGRNLTAGEADQISGAFGFNDTIRFDEGLKSQTITLNGSALPEISQNVTITGQEASNLAISGNNQSGIFTIDAGTRVNISDLAIEDGNASNGGGINNDGALTVSNSNFSGNSGGGGDIYNGGTLAVKYGSGGFNGTLVVDNATAATATFKDTGNFSGDLTVMDINSPGNLQSLSVAGTVTSGSSILVGGTLNDSSIGANSGTVSAGSISGLTIATNSSGGSILANGSITDLSVTENDGTISVSGSGTASNVSIGANTGNFVVGQAGNPDAGTLSCATIGTNSGTVSAGSISGMTVTTNSSGGSILAGSSSGLSITENAGHISIAGQSTADNTSIGTNDGSFVVGDGTDQGSTTNTTIGTNNGTISTGSGTSTTISSNSSTGSVSMGSSSGMTVTTNSGGISIVGASTADNTSIGTNDGTFAVGSGTDQGSTTNTSIGTNNGTFSTGSGTSTTISSNSSTGSVSMGSSSGMTVTTNSGGISIVGQSTADNTSIGTNDGSFVVGSGTDQGSTTNTSIGTNNGTFSTGSGTSTTISSNSSTGSVSMGSSSGMTVTTNSGGISIVGASTADNTSIGTNDGSFVVGSGTDQGSTTNTSIGTNNGTFSTGSGTSTTISSNSSTGSVSMGSSSGMTVTTNSGGISIVGQSTADNTSIGTNDGTFAVGSGTDEGSTTNTTIGTNNGTFSTGSGTSTTISSNSSTGSVSMGSSSGMTVTTNSGGISIVGASKADNTSIGTNTGTFVVGSATDHGSATNTTIGTLGTTGTFTATGTITSLNLTVFSGLVVAGHITDITVMNAPDASQMLNVLEGGIMRSLVLMPTRSSLPSNGTVSYVYDHNSTIGSPNYGDAQLTMAVNDGSDYTGSYDLELLSTSAAPGSGFDLAALYNAGSSQAHIRNVLIEGNLASSAGDANQIGISSSVGGIQLAGSAGIPGTPLASVGIMGNAPAGSINAASVQALSFASIAETLWGGTITIPAFVARPWDAVQLLAPGTAIVQSNNTFLAAVGQTSQGQSQPIALFLDTGKSGTFDPHSVLLGNQGSIVGATNPVLAQVTATDPPSSPSTIQTINLTGDGGSIWTAQEIISSITSSGALGDLILQAPQGIEANVTAPSIFGNIAAPNGGISGIIQATAGNIGRTLSFCNGFVLGVTTIETASGLTGSILSASDLLSWIDVNGGFRGTIAAGGNLGYLQPTSWGWLHRYGGMNIAGGVDGDAVVLGNIYGDISISGGLNGRIAAGQGILGNININGGMGNSSAIVSGGEIGDPGLGTDLDINGAVKGILAAVGTIHYDINGTTKFATILSHATGNNAAAIDAIFSGSTIGDDLLNLNNLHVGSDGNRSDSSEVFADSDASAKRR